MHDLSAAKLYILEDARSSYQVAASSLPVVDVYTDLEEDDTDSYVGYASSDSNESEVLDYYRSAPDTTSPPIYATSPSSVESYDFPQEDACAKLSSSCLPRSFSFVGDWRKEDCKTEHLDDTLFSFPTPPKHLPSTPTTVDRAKSVTFTPSSSTWLHSRIYERFNASLSTFGEMLANHIKAVNALIQQTEEAHATRYTFTRQLSFYGDEEGKAADIKARILRLKATGWRRERFDPEKYQDLCEAALAEL
ncbi:hypothetical protein P7C71_g79, partial [Lecanoromycetidae sp. Uapishka_2]